MKSRNFLSRKFLWRVPSFPLYRQRVGRVPGLTEMVDDGLQALPRVGAAGEDLLAPAELQPALGLLHVGALAVDARNDADDGAVDQAGTAGREHAEGLVRADDQTHHVGLVGVQRQRRAQPRHLGVLAGGVDDGVVVVDVLGLAVVELFTPQSLRQGGFSCGYTTHEDQFFHSFYYWLVVFCFFIRGVREN